MKEMFKSLKSIDQIEDGIAALLSIKSSDADAYGRMYDVLINKLHPIPFPVMTFNPFADDPFVNRSRKNEDGEIFKKITDLASIEDTSKIKSYGRCNKPGQSIFYCAENRQTAISEVLKKSAMDAQNRIIITSGRWLVKKKLTCGMLINYAEAIEANPFVREKYDDFQYFMEETFPEKKEIINRMLDFFSSYFARPFNEFTNDEYKLSSAFFNYALTYCDGLIYPSVKIIYKGLNYAFEHKKFLEGYVELDRTIYNIFEKSGEGEFEDTYRDLDRGIMTESNFIRWHPSIPLQ